MPLTRATQVTARRTCACLRVSATSVRTVRTECLDWTLIWNRQHLQQLLTRYLEHYNTGRLHRGIHLEIPVLAPMTTVTMPPAGWSASTSLAA